VEVELIAGLVLVAVLMAGFGVEEHRIDAVKVQLANEQRAHEADIAAGASAAASAATANLAESARREAAQQEADDASQKLEAQIAADRTLRLSVASRLHNATVATAARCSAGSTHSTAAGVSPAAGSPGDLLANVQSRLGDASGSIADYADALTKSGRECASRYDALKGTP
jgi:Protein of unknown function (DUF2514)